MTASIVWKIADLQRRLSDGYVFAAKYTVDAKDDVYSFGGYGTAKFEEPETLKPFCELTEEEILGWVRATFDEEKLAELERQMIAQVEEQRNPTVGTGLPWGKED